MKQRPAPAAPISRWVWVFAFLLAWSGSTLIPPLQSPDENAHIFRAYMVSRADLLLHPIPADLAHGNHGEAVAAFIERAKRHGGGSGGLIDEGLLKFAEGFMAQAAHIDKTPSRAERDQLAALTWTGKSRYYALPGTGYYLPLIYAPQAIGFALGQWLDLSVMHTYQLARTATLLSCFVLLALAFQALRPNPFVLAMLLLPMSVFQIMSPTLDGLTTAFAILGISLFMRSADRSQKFGTAPAWGLLLCIFMVTTSRTHLLPLLAMPFFLAWQRHSKRDFYLAVALSLATLGWVLFALVSTNDPRIVRSHTTSELIAQYLLHPTNFFEMVYASLTDSNLFTFYQESLVGILGWLDTRLSDWAYPTLWTGLAVCALASISMASVDEDWRARVVLVAVAGASILLVFFALLVTWTPHPATVIQGVQGRYFIVPMILLGYAASGFPKDTPMRRLWTGRIALAAFTACALSAWTMAVLGRYP